jgi:hypothetical protein
MGVELNQVADTAFDVWKYGGQAVVVALVTAALVKAQGSRGDVGAHDRRVADLNQDLRRWVLDRDRELESDLALIAAYARNPDLEGDIARRLNVLRAPVPEELKQHPAGSQYHSGAHLRWRAEAKRRALHQWRDEGTRKLREYHDVIGSEGRVARWVRRRRGTDTPQLVLSEPAREALRRWREPATIPGDEGHESMPVDDDPSRPELEPELAELERTDAS